MSFVGKWKNNQIGLPQQFASLIEGAKSRVWRKWKSKRLSQGSEGIKIHGREVLKERKKKSNRQSLHFIPRV